MITEENLRESNFNSWRKFYNPGREEVLKLPKFIFSKFSQNLNILYIDVTFEASKFDKSTSFKFLNSLNIVSCCKLPFSSTEEPTSSIEI